MPQGVGIRLRRSMIQWDIVALTKALGTLLYQVTELPKWKNSAATQGTHNQAPWSPRNTGAEALLESIRDTLANIQGLPDESLNTYPSVTFPPRGTPPVHPETMMLEYLVQILEELRGRVANDPNHQVGLPASDPPPHEPPEYPDYPEPHYTTWHEYALIYMDRATRLLGIYAAKVIIGSQGPFGLHYDIYTDYVQHCCDWTVVPPGQKKQPAKATKKKPAKPTGKK